MAKILSLNDANKSIGSTLSADEELKQFEKKIILASVDKSRTEPIYYRGIVYYPTETMLREDRLAKQIKNINLKMALAIAGFDIKTVFIIYLNELINKNCKKCNGTGRTGYHPPPPTFLSETSEIITKAVLDKSLTQETTTEFCKLGMDPIILEQFIRDLQDEYDKTGKVNKPAVTMLAKHLREYLVLFFPMYCPYCVMPTYNKKLTELQQEAKFAI